MKKIVEILLFVVLLLPMIHDLNTIEDDVVAVVADGLQHLDNEEPDDAFRASPKTLSLTVLLKATILRRFSIVRVKCLHLLRRKPTVKSSSARHSEMRSGDVPTLRI